MTEAEWLECTDPEKMLEFLGGTGSNRKLRLFAAGCLRRVWDLLLRESQNAVAVAELLADGKANLMKVRAIDAAVNDAYFEVCSRPADWAACNLLGTADEAARKTINFAVRFADENEYGMVSKSPRDQAAQAVLLRDLWPWWRQPGAVRPTWASSNDIAIPKLAQAAYDERQLPEGTLDPSNLAVLADALEEAGCNSADMLDHLRRPGPHVRGCWVVDLILRKN